MKKFMPILNEIEGREWCELNGFIYCGTRIHPVYGYVMEYDDGLSEGISKEEEDYYESLILKEEKKKENEKKNWVIASDDGISSTLYKAEKGYTFYLSGAKVFNKNDAQKTAIMMTKRSRVGRIWKAIKVI